MCNLDYKNSSYSFFKYGENKIGYFSLAKLAELNFKDIEKLPFTLKVLIENILRNYDGYKISQEHLNAFKNYYEKSNLKKIESCLLPTSILLQDYTGIAVATDLSALRGVVAEYGVRADVVNPSIPVHLIIDHSIQVDSFGTSTSLDTNEEQEFKRNSERYSFFKWLENAFDNFTIIPPSSGIVHQINLEYLADIIKVDKHLDEYIAYPNIVLGTDSHTTMINALGVVGWGVGGIEAEAAMLGHPVYFSLPEVVGIRLAGAISEGVTVTDVALTITNVLRKKGVVGKFIEFFGEGVDSLTIPDRATIANMAPEYGATSAVFPVDQACLDYLALTGRDKSQIEITERYCKLQGLFREPSSPDSHYSDVIDFNLSEVELTLAGPKRPQDMISPSEIRSSLKSLFGEPANSTSIKNGDIAIAAITSCTNTSNPALMISAGLLAKKAVELGLTKLPWVKTSFSPGSLVVTEYLRKSGLLTYLEKLGFYLTGYGCTTCNGNSGDLLPEIEQEILSRNIKVASILSGNRNFEGRIHPLVDMNFLASPPMVVAYSIAGSLAVDITHDPLGKDSLGNNIYLKDVWPSSEEVLTIVKAVLNPDIFTASYSDINFRNKAWNSIEVSEGMVYKWAAASTYIQEPPFFDNLENNSMCKRITNARILAKFGDSITTDHISPVGKIDVNSIAGLCLAAKGVQPEAFNSFGARRGNHEIMIRGAFSNSRLRNELVPGELGGITNYYPAEQIISIYDAAMCYKKNNIDTVIIAGQEYGTGSSRDWAAKATLLLGVKAVIAESFESIHRSNLVRMGVLPLQFLPGQNRDTVMLRGDERLDIDPISIETDINQIIKVNVSSTDSNYSFDVVVRIDNKIERDYFLHGGILPMLAKEYIN